MEKPRTQRELAEALLRDKGMLRLVELRKAGVTAATMSRMVRTGEVIRLSRGVYQLTDADLKPRSRCQRESSVSSRRWRFTV